MRKSVFITGATGVMGKASLDAILARGDRDVRLLVRDSKKNRRLLAPYLGRDDVAVVWGDLMNPSDVEEALGQAATVLHMGGMVSPMADRFPVKTLKVNVEGTRNVVEAVKKRPDRDEVALVYIGSVAQTSDRMPPLHWGRAGDPVMAAEFDYYGLSKILAEKVVAESGLKRWVSLRQTGILHPGLFLRGNNPITFHVPLRGVLEWATVEDSGRLMAGVCGDDVPESFWRNFYNIGSGAAYRLTNYEFERLILGTVGSPAPEKIFETNWFATRNFHGCWFADSDRLDEIIPFRANIPVDEYFRRMVRKAPWWTRLAPLAPARLVKRMMRKVARTPGDGTLYWLEHDDCEDRIRAFFGSRKERDAIPGWDAIDLSRPSDTPVLLSHGYDESKPDSSLTIEDCREAARFRGGECLSAEMQPGGETSADKQPADDICAEMQPGNLDTPLRWRCAEGHEFSMTPRLVLKGGHWCPDCLPSYSAPGSPSTWRYRAQASRNPFLSQLLTPSGRL